MTDTKLYCGCGKLIDPQPLDTMKLLEERKMIEASVWACNECGRFTYALPDVQDVTYCPWCKGTGEVE